MPMTTTHLTNKDGETTGTIFFDESTHAWRISSKAEPNFQRTFPSEAKAFYFWYSRFDQQTGKLRHFPPENG
jgi:hypothetical protein